MGKKVLIRADGHANMTDAQAATLEAAVNTFRTACLVAIPDAKVNIQIEVAPTPAT
jgi:hypothetical protein